MCSLHMPKAKQLITFFRQCFKTVMTTLSESLCVYTTKQLFLLLLIWCEVLKAWILMHHHFDSLIQYLSFEDHTFFDTKILTVLQSTLCVVLRGLISHRHLVVSTPSESFVDRTFLFIDRDPI